MPDERPYSRPIKRQTLAEQMASAVEQAIVDGRLAPGQPLPTEPELAAEFAVSRAVVRDATRILMARGLVDVQHGRGVFVTDSPAEAFGEALLLALKRTGASAWDVEQFEQILLPGAVALAAEAATEADLAAMRAAADAYLALFARSQALPEPGAAERERLVAAFRALLQTMLDATHNEVLRHLGRPLLRLRSVRRWASAAGESPAEAAEAALRSETGYVETLLRAVAGRDPGQARETVARLMVLPSEAVAAMKSTPVGQVPEIPVPQPGRVRGTEKARQTG